MPLPCPRVLALSLSVALACGPGDGKTDGGASDSATGSDTSGAPTTGATSATAGTGTSDTGSGTTTDNPTTTDPTTDPTADPTTGDATTGVDVSGFVRFQMDFAAGPCPPEGDCDGFIELRATRMLRVERFGDIGDPVTEVEVSEEDFLAAAQEFADPALHALLDGPDPVCDPPTDIFETMLVDENGSLHEGSTTGCNALPVADARDAAQALMMKYVP